MKKKIGTIIFCMLVVFAVCGIIGNDKAVMAENAEATVSPRGNVTEGTPSPIDGKEVAVNATATPEADNVIIKFVKTKKQIKAGKTYRFKAEVSGTEDKIAWSVNKPECATISKTGKLTAIKAGKITVTATVGDISESAKVKILPKQTIAIDAGHQARANSQTEPIGPGSSAKKAKVAGGTTGVVTKVPEYKLTLAMAKKLKKELVARGYKVVMIRTTNDVNISNRERALKANESSDICIRLHGDACGSSSVSGATALYPTSANKFVANISSASKKLSTCVINAMCKKAGTKNRGLSARDDLTGTNWSKIPVTLIEMGFMTNPAEDRKMQQVNYQKELASGMADGIDEYFGYNN